MIIYIIGVLMTVIFMSLAHHFYLSSITYNVSTKNKIFTKIKNNKRTILFIILSILPLSLISGLRKGIGTDYYYTYYQGFYNILSGNSGYKREPLFNNLNKFIQLFTTDAQWLFVVTSFIFVFFLVISTLRMSKSWALSTLLIVLGNYYFVSMNNVRQACAMSIATLSFSYFVDRKYIRGLIFGALSVGFHSSAIILLPVFLLCSIKNIEKIGYIIILIIISLTAFCSPLINQFTSHFGYSAYFDEAQSEPLWIYIIPYGSILLTSLIYYERLIKINHYSFGLIVIFTFGVIFSILSVKLTLESTLRMTYWFTWPLIFLIPSFIKINDNKLISYMMTTLLLILVGYVTYNASILNGWNEVFPYIDIWGHVIN